MQKYLNFLDFRKQRLKKFKKPKDKEFLIGRCGVAYNPAFYERDDIFIIEIFSKKIVDTLKGF